MATILKAHRIANPGRKKRKLSPLQKLFFGSKRQRASKHGYKQEKLARSKKRRKNIGSILAVSNPTPVRRKRRKLKLRNKRRVIKTMAKRRRRRANPVAKRRRRRTVAVARRRRRRANPVARRRRTYRRRANPRVTVRYRNRRHHRRANGRRRRNPDFLNGTSGMVLGIIGGATLTKIISDQLTTYLPSVTSNPLIAALSTGVVAMAQGHLVGKALKNPSLGKNAMAGGLVVMALQLINYFVPSIGGSLGLSGGRGMGLIAGSSFYTPQVNLPGSMGSFVVPAAIPTMSSSGMSGLGIIGSARASRMNQRRLGRMA